MQGSSWWRAPSRQQILHRQTCDLEVIVPSESGDLHYFRNRKIDIYKKDFLAATRHTRHRVSDCRGQEEPIRTLAEVNTIMTTPSCPIQCCKPFAGRRQLAL